MGLLELSVAVGDVVGGCVAEDVGEGVGLGDVFAGLADDDAELGFVVAAVVGRGESGNRGRGRVGVCEGGGGFPGRVRRITRPFGGEGVELHE